MDTLMPPVVKYKLGHFSKLWGCSYFKTALKLGTVSESGTLLQQTNLDFHIDFAK